MNALRWTLIVLTAIFGAGWAVLVVLGSQFRQSLGASPVGAVVALAPIPIAVLVLASLRTGASRTLLHVAAVVVIGTILLVVWSASGKMDPGLYILFLYLGLWLAYYGWRVLGATAAG